MAEDKDLISLEHIITNITQNLDAEKVIRYDNHVQSIAEEIFYGFGKPNELTGIFQCLINNWKSVHERSQLTKVLPILVTGSIVEGASLARLLHPQAEEILEIEADLMFVVGKISEDVAEECFENIENSPGFFKIRNSEDIMLYTTKEVLKSQETNFSSNIKQPHINGTMFKKMIQRFQPSNNLYSRKYASERYVKDVTNALTELNIKQCLTGPSSEIVFQNEMVDENTKKEMLLSFFEKLICYLQDLNTENLRMSNSLAEHESILIQVIKVFENEIKRTVPILSKDETENMIFQVSIEMKKYASKNEQKSEWNEMASKFFKELRKMLNINKMDKINPLIEDNIDKLDSGNFLLGKLIPDEISSELHEITKSPLNDQVNILSRMLPVRWHSLFKAANNNVDFQETIDAIIALKVQKIENYTNKHVRNNFNKNFISVDNVPCFYCPFWPNIAAEWYERDRLWPSKKEIQKIVNNGCHVVAKSNTINSDEYSWRWSFSLAERKLAQLRNPAQKYCYFLFKSFFYKCIKFYMDDRMLPSYVAKTCMLFVCESHNEEWWGDLGDSSKIATCLSELLEFLKIALKKRHLSNYFIRNMNLFLDYPEKLLERAFVVTESMIKFPHEHLTLEVLPMKKINLLFSDINIDAIDTEREQRDLHSLRFQLIKETIESQRKFVINLAMFLRYGVGTECSLLQKRLTLFEPVVKTLQETVKVFTQAGTNISVVQNTLDNTQKTTSELKEKLKQELEKALLILKLTSKMLKCSCHICDVCSRDVVCGSTYYHCVDDCDYDECLSCFTERKSVIVSTESQDIVGTESNEYNASSGKSEASSSHSHQLTEMTTCSKHCFARLPVERFTEPLFIDKLQHMSNLYFNKLKDIGDNLGSLNVGNIQKNIDDPGKVMLKLLNDVFQEKYGTRGTANTKKEPTTEREEIDLMDRVEDLKYHLNRIDQLKLIVDENGEVPEVNMAERLKQEFKNSTLIENLVSENSRLLRGFVNRFSEHFI